MTTLDVVAHSSEKGKPGTAMLLPTGQVFQGSWPKRSYQNAAEAFYYQLSDNPAQEKKGRESKDRVLDQGIWNTSPEDIDLEDSGEIEKKLEEMAACREKKQLVANK